jgi:hypothetical protein
MSWGIPDEAPAAQGRRLMERGYWLHLLFNDARWYLGRRRPLAFLRTFWRWLHRDNGETCQHCGRPYILWHADDDLYGRVTGRWPYPDGECASGLFCPACFDRMAEARGISLRWRPEIWAGKIWPPEAIHA